MLMGRLGFALRETFQQGYRAGDFRADLMAGAVVGVVALPLSMALAVASGVAPQHGLYTAIVGGAVIAVLGGSRVQVSGPTAAFVVILAPIAAQFGLGGLLLATALAGVLLFTMGAVGMGQLIEFVPYPVTTGFTAGIAVVIATLQIRGVCDFGGSAIGARIPFGIAFDFNNVPLDIFIQLVPVLDFVRGNYYDRYRDRTHFGIDLSVGIRYWFK
jgi:MFS superfamily sulfate permease-like transporter